LLKAGYFEPIPRAWVKPGSNPLKFTIDSSVGWRGITPTWRGYRDTAEERLYWVLNHRLSNATILKPDIISALKSAQARMEQAIEPPSIYYSQDDTCHHLQQAFKGYSKQVMPPPSRLVDAPQQPTDDTVILLDASGSMDSQPRRPEYNQFLIMKHKMISQPKNKGTLYIADELTFQITDCSPRRGPSNYPSLHQRNVQPRQQQVRLRTHHILQ
jgi:hypothetical protein